MKVFRVVTERDGETTKESGKVSAETMQEVWDEIAWIRNDPERTLLAVLEEAPAITVLRKEQE